MFPTSNSIDEDDRTALCECLNVMLATTADLASQAKQAHWNVKGPLFFQLHQLFDQMYGSVNDFVDIVAERVTALGGIAMGTVRMAAAGSDLEDFPPAMDSVAAVVELAKRVAVWTNDARDAIDFALARNDQATADLCIDMTREGDKLLWMLEAHSQLAAGATHD